jgi:hypothetical protein
VSGSLLVILPVTLLVILLEVLSCDAAGTPVAVLAAGMLLALAEPLCCCQQEKKWGWLTAAAAGFLVSHAAALVAQEVLLELCPRAPAAMVSLLPAQLLLLLLPRPRLPSGTAGWL